MHLKRAESGLCWLTSGETKERNPSQVGRMDHVDAANERSSDQQLAAPSPLRRMQVAAG